MKLNWAKIVEMEQKLDACKQLAVDPDGTVVVVFVSIEDGRQLGTVDAEQFRE